ncbi:hypothetical protein Q4E93_20655 [Flavitalea sp. BT771]|uniref:hypothetical protein n=1 Tax=Flavitalea sp. BT771 TaxID=3063329 RepID=UPI0026E3B4EC|nr:hypothetical protein [Flavitalea sp. BT771]MDO6433031.1 hypothetical protein [Flavitalea sp. BT771]MDV6221693.1 hypothetical protein [Flavitalea sp. BT771]
MKRILLVLFVISSFQCLQAQSANATSAEMLTRQRNDSIILADIIMPLVEKSTAVPDWDGLGATVKEKYGDTYVDRSVTKAQIYYYFNKDWPMFCKALVHYTEAYENKDDLRRMNKNAKMVLEYSQSPEELKTAAGWVKYAMNKEPDDHGYKDTYDALTTKIKEKVLGGQ